MNMESLGRVTIQSDFLALFGQQPSQVEMIFDVAAYADGPLDFLRFKENLR